MHRVTMALATLALALTLGGGDAWASSIPPIWTPPPAGPTAQPVEAIVDTVEPVTECGDWYLQNAYANTWGTDGTWWEYTCSPVGMRDQDDPFWIDHYYWDGSRSVFYGRWDMYWDYWYVGGACWYWWDEATATSYDAFGCYDEVPPFAVMSESCTGLSCSFDGSASFDLNGTIVRHQWSFGDGETATGATVEHSYAQSGSYTVTLTVTDADGGTASTSKTVVVGTPNGPPLAVLEAGCAGLSCSFDGRGSSDDDGSVVRYDWSFGDGATAAGATATHAYGQPGSYSVTLTVTDDDGASASASTTVVAVAPNRAPTAAVTMSCVGLSCVFDGRGSTDTDGTVVRHEWRFGDGATATGATVGHTYAQPGTYSVTLTVTDDDGAVAEASATVATIVLTATPSKAKGLQRVTLAWSGSSAAGFDVYRGGVKLATVGAAGYIDDLGRKGAATYVYRVCAVGSAICSTDVTVTF